MALKACDRSVICSLFLIGTSQILEETDTVSLDHLVIGLCLAQPANHRALFHLPYLPKKAFDGVYTHDVLSLDFICCEA